MKLLIAPDATVKLIDCDSFQIIDQGKRYPCEVGVERFTPPELQGRNLREVIRTANHDGIGLAVMIFPSCLWDDIRSPDGFWAEGTMPIPKVILELRFAYRPMRADVEIDKHERSLL